MAGLSVVAADPGEPSQAEGVRHELRVFRRLTAASLRAYSSQRLLGWLWWILDPLILIAVYALVFGELLHLRQGPEGTDYPFFLTCALVPWRWFSLATRRGGGAFVTSTPLLSSTLVNRRVIVTSQAAAATIECLLGLVVLLAMMIVYERPWSPALLMMAAPLAVMALHILAISYLLAPLMVMLPDLGNFYEMFLRLGFFLTPCLYSLERVPEAHRGWYVIVNPLVGVIEGIRRPMYEGLAPLWEPLGWSAAWAVMLLIIGNWSFKRLGNDAIRML
jgi:ABC-type polysaccharide/polyol phosphate export permease